jgi:hypothetical protein
MKLKGGRRPSILALHLLISELPIAVVVLYPYFEKVMVPDMNEVLDALLLRISSPQTRRAGDAFFQRIPWTYHSRTGQIISTRLTPNRPRGMTGEKAPLKLNKKCPC